jgi:trimeric autotransporter adhesin
MKSVVQSFGAFSTIAVIYLLTASQSQATPLAYALANGGTQLVSFDLTTPGVTTAIGTFAGAAERIDGIDFRPFDGQLYGYSQQNNRIVTINLNNAFTSFVSTPTTGSSVRNVGIDFNPVADRLRVVNPPDQNLRINVTTGATTVDGNLAYAAGDPHFGVNPVINEVAYTNSDINPATGTALYYIDNALDTLVTTINPNAGVLTTVGFLGINAGELTGFDILSDGVGGNAAYAILVNQSIHSLYRVNLGTGAASLVGPISNEAVRPFSLAIVQPTIPEPSSGVIAGLLTLITACSTSRRRRTEETR